MKLERVGAYMVPTCPYCHVLARLTVGPYGKRWDCPEPGCDARVGVHRDSPRCLPLGTMARAPLRVLRMRVHSAFDPLWRTPGAPSKRPLS